MGWFDDILNPTSDTQQGDYPTSLFGGDQSSDPNNQSGQTDNTQPQVFTCPNCGATFNTQAELDAHLADEEAKKKEAADKAAADAKAAQDKADADAKAQAEAAAQADEQKQQDQANQEQQGTFLEAHYKDNPLGNTPNWWDSQNTDYSMPASPYKDLNQDYGSVLAIYRAFGIPTGQQMGPSNNLAAIMGSARTLPDDYFRTNVPLSLWLPDGQLIKADNPEEFKQLVMFAQDNDKYLPGVGTQPQSNNGVQLKTFQDFQDWVAQQKAEDTPEKQNLDYWTLMSGRNQEYQSNADQVIGFLAPVYDGAGNQINTYYDNLSDAQKSAIDEGKIPSLNSEEMKTLPNKARIYLDRTQWQSREQFGQDVSAQLAKAQEEYDTQETKRLPDAWSYKTENPDNPTQTQSVIITPQGWKRYQNDYYESPDGEIYKAQDIIDNPDLMKPFADSISDKDVQHLSEWMDANPKQAVKMLGAAGDTPEVRAILQKGLPNTTPQEQDAIIRALPQTNGQVMNDLLTIRKIVNSPRTPENDKKLAQLLGHPQQQTDWNPSNAGIQDNPVLRGWIAGQGQMREGMGQALERIGLKDAGAAMVNDGLKWMAVAPSATGNAFVDSLNELNQQVPFMLTMVGLSMIGGEFGGGISEASGGSRLATTINTIGARFGVSGFWSKVLGSIGAGALETPFMSAIMAGQTRQDAIEKGWSEEQANAAFDKMAIGMGTVTGLLNAVTFGVGNANVGKGILQRLIAKGANPKLANIAIQGGKVGIAGLTGAGNMMYIQALQKYALNEPIDNQEMAQAALMGGVLGFLTGGTEVWASKIKDKTVEKAYELNPNRYEDLHRRWLEWKYKSVGEDIAAAGRSTEAGRTTSQPQETIDFILENEADLRAKAKSQQKEESFNKWFDWMKEQATKKNETLNKAFGDPNWPDKSKSPPPELQKELDELAGTPEGKQAITDAVSETKNEMIAKEIEDAKKRQPTIEAKEKATNEKAQPTVEATTAGAEPPPEPSTAPTQPKTAEEKYGFAKHRETKQPEITVDSLKKEFPNATDDELNAIKSAREAKQARGGTTPQFKPTETNTTRDQVKTKLQQNFSMSNEQVDGMMALLDARAKMAGEKLNMTPEEYYAKTFKDIEEGKGAGLQSPSSAASVSFTEDGKAVIKALKGANIADAVHELGHVFRRQLDGSDLRIAEEFSGVKDGKWEKQHEEKFANAFGKYLNDKIKPEATDISKVFEKLKTFLSGIWMAIRGKPLGDQLTPELKEVFDRMVGEGIEHPFYSKYVDNAEKPTVNKLINLVEQAKPQRWKIGQEQHAELQRRAAALDSIHKMQLGDASYAQELAALKGQLTGYGFDAIGEKLTQDEKDTLARIIQRSDLQPFTKLNAEGALKAMYDGNVPTEGQIKLLENVFSQDLANSLYYKSMQQGKMTIAKEILDVLNIPKATLASLDLSATMRQGGFFLFGYPKQSWEAFKGELKAYVDPKMREEVLQSVLQSPNREIYVNSKTYFATEGRRTGNIVNYEEGRMTSWLGKVPLLKQSQDAYEVYLDLQRLGVGDGILAAARRAGEDVNSPEFLNNFGRLMNIGTGRGELGKIGNSLAPLTNVLLFSSRYFAAVPERALFPMMMEMKGANVQEKLTNFANSAVTKAWIRAQIARVAGTLTIMGLAKMIGGDGVQLEGDPTSTDFGKIRWGNQVFDTGAGDNQWIRLAAQVITGKQKDSMTGAVTEKNKWDAVVNFLHNKSAPVTGQVISYLQGQKNIIGIPEIPAIADKLGIPHGNTDTAQWVFNFFTPLIAQDIVDGFVDNGIIGSGFAAVPDLLGVGVQVYAPESRASGGFGAVYKQTEANSAKLKDLILSKDTTGIKQFNSANPNHKKIKAIIGAAEQQIGTLNTQRHQVELDPSLNDATRQTKLKTIDKKKYDLQMTALEKIKKYK